MRLPEATESRLREVFELVGPYAKDASDAVFRALQHAHWLIRRMPAVSGLREEYGNSWPAFMLSDEERMDAYFHLQWLIVKGHEAEVETAAPISPREMAMVDDVMEVFRNCCVGAHIARDWSIINLLAMGIAVAGVGKRQRPKVGRLVVLERQHCQCSAIGYKLRHLMDGFDE